MIITIRLKNNIKTKQDKIILISDNSQRQGNRRGERSTIRHDYSNMVGRRPVASDSEKATLEKELKELESELKLEEDLLANLQKTIDEWKYPTCREDLREFARMTVIKPAIDYYMHHFKDSSGDLFKFKKALGMQNI